jgi:rod shape-determining protein MreC
MLLLGGLAFILILLDYRYSLLNPVRYTFSTLSTPFYWLADSPARLFNWGSEHTVSRSTLIEENSALRAELLILRGRIEKLAVTSAENARLRELLNSTALLDDSVVVAELINVSPNPASHLVVLNKGEVDKVYPGQPVIDSEGLMGQVIEVSRYNSRVMLLTDSTHALPVQVNRNGVRAIAEGTGLLDELVLRHVAATTDIQPGDLLVSSGLGKRFPVGYPVGIVESVEPDPGKPFMLVRARPSAHLNRSRHVLLVYTSSNDNNTTAEPD